ncbi:hypothetical protein [Rummeliibacillus suwonensis]|jgi:hypothetical protein|nr:hypothetical protein [Rummeliibacillus suwonensis]MBO2536966.1 hypothetical protein [Rummeliibacillus suwonensis]
MEKNNDPILDAEIVGEALNRLCDQLGKDIEQQFEISLKTYMDQVPMHE